MTLIARDKLVVIVPALFEPEVLARLDQSSSQFPLLIRLLNRADRGTNDLQTTEQAVLHSLGYESVSADALPVAQCTYLADFSESAVSVVRADPVHLKADSDNARLYSSRALDLSNNDAEQIVSDLNHHFEEDGLMFSVGCNYRWFLSLRKSASLRAGDLKALPVTQVNGRNISHFLPDSESAHGWKQLLTEVQMLLHEHPVNLKRQAEGLLPLNSLWFFGGHGLPARRAEPRLRLYADDAFSRGLARLSAISEFPLAESAQAVRRLDGRMANNNKAGNAQSASVPAPALLVVERALERAVVAGQSEQIEAVLVRLEKLIASAQSRLWRGKLGSLELLPCDGTSVAASLADLLCFWRSGFRDDLRSLQDRPPAGADHSLPGHRDQNPYGSH